MSITAILPLLVSCLKLISCASELSQLSAIFLLFIKFLYLISCKRQACSENLNVKYLKYTKG